MNDPGFKALSNAIILQAVEDYRHARYRHILRPYRVETQQEIRNIEQFFRSDWFSILCSLDGRKLLHDLNKQMEGTI